MQAVSSINTMVEVIDKINKASGQYLSIDS